MSEAKILLVDDETEFTSALSERLTDRGFEVKTAKDGYEAMEKVNAENFDVIFLDLAMPGIDGIETLKLIFQKNPKLLVYLLTGKATVQKGVEAVKLGAQDVLEKPVEFNDLIARIKEAEAKKLETEMSEHEKRIDEILKSKSW